MPRADFYLIAKPRFREEPLRLVCELVRKAWAGNLWTLVLARDAEQAEQLDELLWDMGDDAYIPHQVAGDEEDELTPVLIAPPEIDAPLRALVINLREEAAEGAFDWVKEVVPADPAEREGSRKRWAEYRKRGFEVVKYDL